MNKPSQRNSEKTTIKADDSDSEKSSVSLTGRKRNEMREHPHTTSFHSLNTANVAILKLSTKITSPLSLQSLDLTLLKETWMCDENVLRQMTKAGSARCVSPVLR